MAPAPPSRGPHRRCTTAAAATAAGGCPPCWAPRRGGGAAPNQADETIGQSAQGRIIGAAPACGLSRSHSPAYIQPIHPAHYPPPSFGRAGTFARGLTLGGASPQATRGRRGRTPMQIRCALVGMPGAGKSTVGQRLADRVGVPFIDLDQWLEQAI